MQSKSKTYACQINFSCLQVFIKKTIHLMQYLTSIWTARWAKLQQRRIKMNCKQLPMCQCYVLDQQIRIHVGLQKILFTRINVILKIVYQCQYVVNLPLFVASSLALFTDQLSLQIAIIFLLAIFLNRSTLAIFRSSKEIDFHQNIRMSVAFVYCWRIECLLAVRESILMRVSSYRQNLKILSEMISVASSLSNDQF